MKLTYRADLLVLPLKFKDFIALIKIREKIRMQTNPAYYMESWKRKLEIYVASIPDYYLSYIHACLNSMKLCDGEIFDKKKPRLLSKA